jgi:outer membrane lipoprotein-sorting protein
MNRCLLVFFSILGILVISAGCIESDNQSSPVFYNISNSFKDLTSIFGYYPSADDIVSQYISHEEIPLSFSTNGTVGIYRYGMLRNYSFFECAQRPDHYYLRWTDDSGNITDIFIANGTDQYHILPGLDQARYSSWLERIHGTNKYSEPESERPGAEYDILEQVASPIRGKKENLTRNISIETNNEYIIEFSTNSYFGGVAKPMIRMAIDRTNLTLRSMEIDGHENNKMLTILFSDVTTSPQFTSSQFQLPLEWENKVLPDITAYSNPLYPVFNAPSAPVYFPYQPVPMTPTPIMK